MASEMIGAKDLLLQTGVIVTLVLGVVNLYLNLQSAKRTAFVNAVTSERIKWIAKVRENVSTLCALCDQWLHHRRDNNLAELARQIEQVKNEIRLQMNPEDPEDMDIVRLLARLPSPSIGLSSEEYVRLQENLVTATQSMLKREWDKVKDEATLGDLRKR